MSTYCLLKPDQLPECVWEDIGWTQVLESGTRKSHPLSTHFFSEFDARLMMMERVIGFLRAEMYAIIRPSMRFHLSTMNVSLPGLRILLTPSMLWLQ